MGRKTRRLSNVIARTWWARDCSRLIVSPFLDTKTSFTTALPQLSQPLYIILYLLICPRLSPIPPVIPACTAFKDVPGAGEIFNKRDLFLPGGFYTRYTPNKQRSRLPYSPSTTCRSFQTLLDQFRQSR